MTLPRAADDVLLQKRTEDLMKFIKPGQHEAFVDALTLWMDHVHGRLDAIRRGEKFEEEKAR